MVDINTYMLPRLLIVLKTILNFFRKNYLNKRSEIYEKKAISYH